MARNINRLSVVGVKALAAPGLHADGRGLYLAITESGAKSWRYIYKVRGRRTELGLGPYPAISLAAARDKANEGETLRAQGIDPKAHWKQCAEAESLHTFGVLATEFIDGHEGGWKNAKHKQQWRNTLQTYARPIWDRPVSDITVDDVTAILRPIWADKPGTASRVRGRIERVLDAARVRGFRTGENPAAWRGNLALLMPRLRKGPKRHHPAMPYADVPAFMTKLTQRPALGSRT